MMSHSTRFATFEFFRIIVPGIYFALLLSILAVVFEFPFFLFDSSGMMFILFSVVTLVSGLTLYAKETPKHRKAFQANQPSSFVLERSRQISSRQPLTPDEARRLYFYILNHHMPVTTHDKVFFFGMVYHIMINIRRTSFWFGMLGFAGLILQIVLTQFMTPASVVAVLVVWLVYFLNVRYNKADRKMQENYLDQIFWLEMNAETVDQLIRRRLQPQHDHE
jgi:hypothetical protein